MTHNQLSQLVNGCCGIMKLENGKIVFEFEMVQPSAPPLIEMVQPSAPPLIEDNPIVDELRSELRETKQQLADLEKRVQEFFTFNNTVGNAGYNFECDKIKFCECMHNLQHFGVGFKVYLGDENRLYGDFADYSPNTVKGVKSLRNLRTIRLDFSYELYPNPSMKKINNKSLGPQDKLLISTIIEITNVSQNNIEIIFDFSSEKILRIDYIIALCEQLNHEKLSKLKITNAKISEQTELKNKIDKKIFNKIEIENLMTSL